MTEGNLCNTDVVSFQREILPIMVSGCAYSGCHDAATAEDDVVLENYQQIRNEVTPGDPNDSEIYESITDNPNDEDFMPPSPPIPLSSEQITTVRRWIEQGAPNTDCNVPCNSTNTSFVADIYPLIEDHCLGCHQPTNTLGNVNLVDYAHVRSYVINGSLVGSMKHTPGFFAMPPTGNKMTDCQIAQVQNWVIEGALDN
ncbi:MAG: hypothetical protein ACI85O_000986 [Saprospiraceae bacterium]